MTTDERIRRLQRRARATGWRLFSVLVILLLSAFGVWAATAELDEVAIAPGEVKPRGKVRTIQHLEGGIVEEILVRDGDIVEQGQPLLQVQLAPNQVNREELLYRIDGLLLSAARHHAAAAGEELVFPEGPAERRPDIVQNERDLYEARRRQYESQRNALEAKLRQREAEYAELQSKRRALDGNLAVQMKRFEMSARLLERELTPKLEHLQLEADITQLRGELDVVEKSIPRVQASIDEARALLREEELGLRSEASGALGKDELEIGRLRELLSEATDQQIRATVRSPLAGVVKNMTANTIGGVIRPGDPIMEIVPLDETLVVLARLSPADRGYVEVGQKAQVKITGYDFFQFGSLDGRVVRIAADANRLPSTGEPYFEVAIETEGSFVDKSGAILPVTAGMQASVDIHTGERSVLTYLLKPFLRLKEEGFRER